MLKHAFSSTLIRKRSLNKKLRAFLQTACLLIHIFLSQIFFIEIRKEPYIPGAEIQLLYQNERQGSAVFPTRI